MAGSTARSEFHLLDLTALVVGYGMASLLVRAFWPSAGGPSVVALFFMGLEFTWLGLAMSGPIVLLLHRRPPDDNSDLPEPHSWAEMAWLLIGFYWIGLTILVVPIRLPDARLLDAAILGVFPILAAFGLRFFGAKRFATRPTKPIWTHRAAVGLLVSWPFAWAILIVLGKTL
jgi:hypothetical protein